MNDFNIADNFKLSEFECRHCGTVRLSNRLVTLLQALRDTLGAPVVITSGYRCPTHNKAVGGSERSYHMQGKAVDIRVAPTGLSMQALASLCEKIGFKGIGINPAKGFIHVDVRDTKETVRFLY